ncbi:hypothetical protein BDV33DRAFT_210852 [Aspergillus novoparasiticus]|uniref:HotDog domain-containing protein n=1 Tax=Aspergillus novoparasiticus TaxID=986946 RepID=A0A5N6E7P8_9EURO|nr:hypothetical protein BDV33DRAFT_210852 [Aspergillus novoparasiticus]
MVTLGRLGRHHITNSTVRLRSSIPSTSRSTASPQRNKFRSQDATEKNGDNHTDDDSGALPNGTRASSANSAMPCERRQQWRQRNPSWPFAPAQELLNTLLHGYRPTFRRHPLGWEADALLELAPCQQMCYYDGKLFGGYLALLLDRILADCCQPAVTAYLHTSFLHSVPPDVPIRLRAWPEKVDRRKIYLVGSIQIPGSTAGETVEAIRARALFELGWQSPEWILSRAAAVDSEEDGNRPWEPGAGS